MGLTSWCVFACFSKRSIVYIAVTTFWIPAIFRRSRQELAHSQSLAVAYPTATIEAGYFSKLFACTFKIKTVSLITPIYKNFVNVTKNNNNNYFSVFDKHRKTENSMGYISISVLSFLLKNRKIENARRYIPFLLVFNCFRKRKIENWQKCDLQP